MLEGITLGWNAVGVIVLGIAAYRAGSVALLGFGLDSLIEIGASIVVIWELSGTDETRRRRALRLIGVAFAVLACYLLAQAVVALVAGSHALPSPLGIGWTAVTAIAMFALSAAKVRTGRALGNPVLQSEGRVTFVDGVLATSVLIGLTLTAVFGWWWVDPIATLVIVGYAGREAAELLRAPRD